MAPEGSVSADPPFVFSQRPMSYRSGPDSTVASSVTMKGVGSDGSQLDGPATRCMLPIRTSFAVHGGLPPTFSVMQRLLLDWANAGVAAPIRHPAKQLNIVSAKGRRIAEGP